MSLSIRVYLQLISLYVTIIIINNLPYDGLDHWHNRVVIRDFELIFSDFELVFNVNHSFDLDLVWIVIRIFRWAVISFANECFSYTEKTKNLLRTDDYECTFLFYLYTPVNVMILVWGSFKSIETYLIPRIYSDCCDILRLKPVWKVFEDVLECVIKFVDDFRRRETTSSSKYVTVILLNYVIHLWPYGKLKPVGDFVVPGNDFELITNRKYWHFTRLTGQEELKSDGRRSRGILAIYIASDRKTTGIRLNWYIRIGKDSDDCKQSMSSSGIKRNRLIFE